MSLAKQRAGLLRAIIEEPNQDFPRLIFADWLSDNGQPEWGDFIRWHCALTTCFPGTSEPFAIFHTAPQAQNLLVPPCYLRPNLRQAILQPLSPLIQHLVPDWDGDTLTSPEMHCLVGRGFIEWLQFTGSRAVTEFTQFAPAIFSSTPLLWLSLDDRFEGRQNNRVTAAQLRALLRLPALRQLRALDLQDIRCDDQMAEVLLRHADNLPLFRVYDELQSDSIRRRLQATFGERMKIRPVPDYYSRS